MSKFLPPSWDSSAPIGLLAGSGALGSYPWQLVHSARAAGVPLKLVALKGETSPELEGLFDKTNSRCVRVGDVGGSFRAFKELGLKGLVMAGSVNTGHVFKEAFPDARALALWATIKEKNAEAILGAVAAEIEKADVRVLDARVFMDDEIATPGVMTKPSEKVSEDALNHATRIAELSAGNDIGQSVVCRKGTVLAVEAFEGTDAMILRCGDFKADQKIFVKTVKARQDWRFDVPIFGLKTLQNLVKARVRTVALKAGAVIMPQRDDILALAKKEGVGILGYT